MTNVKKTYICTFVLFDRKINLSYILCLKLEIIKENIAFTT